MFALLSLDVFAVEAQSKTYKLIIFEGSDWCANCIRLEQNVLSDPAFSSFVSKSNIITEHIDFPQRKTLDKTTRQYNAAVAEKYNFNGVFPTILLVETETDTVKKIVYRNETSEEFIALLTSKLASD